MKKHKRIFKILFIFLFIFMMTGCQSIDNLDFNQYCLKCGEDIYFPVFLVKLVANLFQFVQIMVPVAIIIVGLIELFKAVIASDENKMTESKNALIRKIISGVLIFLIVAVVRFAFTVIPNFADGDVDAMECMANFINGVEYSDACPSRINGKPVGTKDDESGLKPGDWTPVKKDGTIEDCHGLNYDQCANNDYYYCKWDEKCNECTSIAGGHPCDEKCYECTLSNGLKTYKMYSNPPTNCRLAVTKNGNPMDRTNCNAAAKAAEEQQKRNGKCYLCDYGYKSYNNEGKTLVWKGKDEKVDTNHCEEKPGITYENCSGVINKDTRKCYRCKYSGRIQYSFVVESPNEDKCDNGDDGILLNVKDKEHCNARWDAAYKNGGICWSCKNGSYAWALKNPGTEFNPCQLAKSDDECDEKVRAGEVPDDNGKCWRCNFNKIEFKWQEDHPMPGDPGLCEEVEIKDKGECNQAGYSKLEKAKNIYGHCYKCGRSSKGLEWMRQQATAGWSCVHALIPADCDINYYWAPKGVTTTGNWYCELKEDINQFDCEYKEKYESDIVELLKNE